MVIIIKFFFGFGFIIEMWEMIGESWYIKCYNVKRVSFVLEIDIV